MTIERTPEQTQTTLKELNAIENGIETRKFWRALRNFITELEAIPIHRRRAWINWFTAHQDENEKRERQREQAERVAQATQDRPAVTSDERTD